MKTKDEILEALGWPIYSAALHDFEEAQDKYDLASVTGYPVREAKALRLAEAKLIDAGKEYPGAALYARAREYALSTHDQKAAIGLEAIRAIEAGEDPASVVSDMKLAWIASASQADARS